MLQMTAGRAQGDRYAAPIVVANARHADLVEQQLADAGATPQALILEPAGRNTAPAIALAAIAAGGGGDALLVMPSDHVIEGDLNSRIRESHKAAADGLIRRSVDEGTIRRATSRH